MCTCNPDQEKLKCKVLGCCVGTQFQLKHCKGILTYAAECILCSVQCAVKIQDYIGMNAPSFTNASFPIFLHIKTGYMLIQIAWEKLKGNINPTGEHDHMSSAWRPSAFNHSVQQRIEWLLTSEAQTVLYMLKSHLLTVAWCVCKEIWQVSRNCILDLINQEP